LLPALLKGGVGSTAASRLPEQNSLALAEANRTYHTVLVFHLENPELPSAGSAERLTARLGKCFTAAHVRVTLQRAREKFAELLLDEVEPPGHCTGAEVDQELHALRMWNLCAAARER
jgi:hypothetical protein